VIREPSTVIGSQRLAFSISRTAICHNCQQSYSGVGGWGTGSTGLPADGINTIRRVFFEDGCAAFWGCVVGGDNGGLEGAQRYALMPGNLA
jgi:hypothetical protein